MRYILLICFDAAPERSEAKRNKSKMFNYSVVEALSERRKLKWEDAGCCPLNLTLRKFFPRRASPKRRKKVPIRRMERMSVNYLLCERRKYLSRVIYIVQYGITVNNCILFCTRLFSIHFTLIVFVLLLMTHRRWNILFFSPLFYSFT